MAVFLNPTPVSEVNQVYAELGQSMEQDDYCVHAVFWTVTRTIIKVVR